MTIGYGIVAVVGIVACLYMAEHGYEWWQIVLFSMCLGPAYKVTYCKED